MGKEFVNERAMKFKFCGLTKADFYTVTYFSIAFILLTGSDRLLIPCSFKNSPSLGLTSMTGYLCSRLINPFTIPNCISCLCVDV